MTYNFLFEIASICILSLILYDYKNKMKVYRRDGALFKFVVVISLAVSGSDLFSSILINYATPAHLQLAIVVTTLYFLFQGAMILSLVIFSFCYINTNFTYKSVSFGIVLALFVVNEIIALLSPWTGWFFRFDSDMNYIQGPLADFGYVAYFINALACFLFALYHKKQILKKDFKVAIVVALIICVAVSFQFILKDVLMIGFGMALIILYIYLTLENPNDYQDKLTLCINNYGFKILINSKCDDGKPYTVVALDIKKFRYINAIYGSDMGNILLRKIGTFLEETFPNEIICRADDDVFAIAFSKPKDEIEQAVEIINKRFESCWTFPDGRATTVDIVTITCEYPQHFRNHTELIKLSECMFAKAKETNDENVIYSNDILANEYRRFEAVEKALRNALENKTLKVVYQPIYDSRVKKITSVEALSRLTDPQMGFISPDEFIKVAEKRGLIVELGFYVLEEVCNFIQSNLLGNSRNTITRVHINMSMLQCAFPNSNKVYMEIIEKHNIPPEMVHFELTESSMIGSPELVKDTMRELMKLGISFSLDDYGTGFSNISYLLQFPFNMIKFDKNMVWSYFDDLIARTIMENEFHIFGIIKKEIVVEGIETKEQYDVLRRQGICQFQGYYFSKPVPAEECMQVVYDWSNKNIDKERTKGISDSITEAKRAEMLISKLLQTDYDSIATIDVQTEIAYPFSVSDSELGMKKVLDMQEDADDIASGLEGFFRQFCIPEDVERAIEENSMPVIKAALEKSETYESIYCVNFGRGIERKRALYAYLDKGKNYLICAVSNITETHKKDEELLNKLASSCGNGSENISASDLEETLKRKEQTLLNSIPAGTAIYRLKKSGRVETDYISDGFAKKCGYKKAEDLLDRIRYDAKPLIDQEDYKRINKSIVSVIENENPMENIIKETYKVYSKNNEEIEITMDANVVLDNDLNDDDVAVIYAVHNLITEDAKIAELERSRYRMVLEMLGLAYWEWSIENGYYNSEKYNEYMISEYSKGEIQDPDFYMKCVHPDDIDIATEFMAVDKPGEQRRTVILRAALKDGTYRWTEMCAFMDVNDEEVPTRIITVMRDVDKEWIEQKEKLEIDELTGVYNRRHIENNLSICVTEAHNNNENFAIAMVDVDSFKELNDTFGHLAGDEALKCVAEVLEKNFAVNRGDFVARFGGDEFIIASKGISKELFVERLIYVVELISNLKIKNHPDMRIGISVGTASLDEISGSSEKELIKAADERLYTAKSLGKGCVIS